MNYMKINTVTRWLKISVIKTKTNSRNTRCDKWRQRRLLPRTADIYQGARSA